MGVWWVIYNLGDGAWIVTISCFEYMYYNKLGFGWFVIVEFLFIYLFLSWHYNFFFLGGSVLNFLFGTCNIAILSAAEIQLFQCILINYRKKKKKKKFPSFFFFFFHLKKICYINIWVSCKDRCSLECIQMFFFIEYDRLFLIFLKYHANLLLNIFKLWIQLFIYQSLVLSWVDLAR